MTERRIRSITAGVFGALAASLYLAFLIGDVEGTETTWIKYALILACVAFSLVWTQLPRIEQVLLFFALLLTACADWFLLVKDAGYLYGLSFFSAVQIFHMIRLCILRETKPWRGIVARLIFFGIVAGVLAGMGMNDPVLYVAAFYFGCLLGNTASAFLLARKCKKYYMLAIGFVLFVLCDIFVGLNNASGFIDGISSAQFGHISWVFYAPSQVLIAFSGRLRTKEGEE